MEYRRCMYAASDVCPLGLIQKIVAFKHDSRITCRLPRVPTRAFSAVAGRYGVICV
jgi:hypothetical protein